MAKVYAEQVKKAQTLVEGLKVNFDLVKSRCDITMEQVKALEEAATFQFPTKLVFYPCSQITLITSISKNLAESWKLVCKVFYRWFCPFAVMDIGFMYLDSHWQSQSINNDMLFSSLNLLVSIYTSIRIYMVGSLDASGVYNGQTWTFFFTHRLPCFGMKHIQQFFPNSFKLPFRK